jgi:starch-binding outer membrane protein SusE/F
MKRNTNTISRFYCAVTLLSLVTLISCSDDDNPRQVPLDVGVLSATKSELVIDFDREAAEAITFTWHAEKTPRVGYKLVFSANGKIDSLNVFSAVRKRFVYAEFNRILLDKLGLEPGKQANVEVQIHGKVVKGANTGSSNVLTMAVTPSAKFAEPPLQVSTSKPAVAVDLVHPNTETVVLSWAPLRYMFIEGLLTLSAGSKSTTFDVTTDIRKEFSNAAINTILLDSLGIEPGQATEVTAQIQGRALATDRTVTSAPMTFTVTPVAKDAVKPPYTRMWIVGEHTPKRWDIGNPDEMLADPLDVYQFKYAEVMYDAFKIPTATGSWDVDTYMPPADGADITGTDVVLMKNGSPDYKWKFPNEGPYKILLNTSATPFIQTTPFVPYQLYILGDATAAGWNPDNALAMTADPENPQVSTWTGELNILANAEFIFAISTDPANTTFFAAPTTAADVKTTRVAFTTTGAPVNKFKLKDGEEGTYKITINQFKETISIVKQ